MNHHLIMRPIRLVATCHILNRQISKSTSILPIAARHFSDDNGHSKDKNQSKRYPFYAAAIGAAGFATLLVAYKDIEAFSISRKEHNQHKPRVFDREEVRKHNSLDKGVWITYKGNVYDITDFIKHHPGGSHTIMMGAGGDVEAFWKTYTVHEAIEVQNLLSKYKIGVLSKEEQQLQLASSPALEGPYSNDPERNPLMRVLSKQPFNAETPSKLLTPTQITPTDIFFVRNHLPVPEVDLEDYSLTICTGTDKDPEGQKILAEFTLDDLKKKFKPHTIECVIQCSGNRRSDLKRLKEIKGLDWNVGAIGNARWTGVRLVDLLDSINVKPDEKIKHVQAEGLDSDMSGQAYGSSISADVALDPRKDVLLAYEMNGKPLSRDHGFPLRFVAPGITGARNVKWLSKLILSHEESNSHWQRNDYKSFSPNVDMFNLDYKQSISIQEMPVQSAICDPAHGEMLSLKHSENIVIPVKGFAYSGGGKMIVRVDVSIDGGCTWMTAKLDDFPDNADGTPDYTERNRIWSWTRWSLDVPVPDGLGRDGVGSLEILCRAFDSAYNSQPERAETVWNVRGVVNNSWHRIRLNLKIIDRQ